VRKSKNTAVGQLSGSAPDMSGVHRTVYVERSATEDSQALYHRTVQCAPDSLANGRLLQTSTVSRHGQGIGPCVVLDTSIKILASSMGVCTSTLTLYLPHLH
jgi:hypothetical protein